MILINIETLSDSELRYIAQQENLEDWESLSREELIEELEDFYDEDSLNDSKDRLSAEKFTKTLTSTPSDNSIAFPGLEKIPDIYNENSIYSVIRDSNWAYVFWNLSKSKLEEINELSNYNLYLRTYIQKAAEVESFDVEVTLNDNNWNIELPWKDCFYSIKLILKTSNGEEKLCETKKFIIKSSYFAKNSKEIFDPKVKSCLFDPLYSMDNKLINNRDVVDLLNSAKEAK